MHNHKDPRKGSVADVATAAVIVLLLVYVLSPVPAVCLCENRLDSKYTNGINVIFRPLAWIYDHVRPVKRFYDSYFQLFGFR